MVSVLSGGAAKLIEAEAAYAQLGATLLRRPGHLDWRPDELAVEARNVRGKIGSVDLRGLREDMGIVRGIVRRFLESDALRALQSLDGDKPARYEALFRAIAESRADAAAAAVPLSDPVEPATVTDGPMPTRPAQTPTVAPRKNPLGRYARHRSEQ